MPSLVGNIANSISSVRNRDGNRPSMTPPGILSGFSGVGAEAQLRTLIYSSTLYQAIRKRGTAVGEVKWHLYQKRDGRGRLSGDEDRREIFRHPALALLERPNPFMSKSFFIETLSMYLDCTGRAYVYNLASDAPLFKNTARQPLELWPLPPQWMSQVPDPDRFLAGFVFTSPDGQRVPYTTDQVYWFRIPHPIDPYDGLGPVQPLLTTLRSDRLAKLYNEMFFQNSAEPGGVVEAPNGLSKEEWEMLHEDWEAAHRGVANAGRVAVLSRSQWKSTNPTMRDMQFQELLAQSRELILEGTGVSKTMLGQTEDVNRATAEAAENVFAKYTQRESLNRLGEWLNIDYLPRFPGGDRYEFEYENPVTDDHEAVNADRDSRAQTVVSLINAGFDPSATLIAFGFPDLPVAELEPTVERTDNGEDEE